MILSRRIYIVLAWALFAAVMIQIFLAGLGTFTDPSYWSQHTTFVHFFELIPAILFGLSFPARLTGLPRGLPLIAFLLIGFQYGTAAARPELVAALHTVNAVIIAGAAFHLARSVRAAEA